MNENNDRRGSRARRRETAWRMGAAGPVLAALDSGDATVWQDFAACAETDPDEFFPTDGKRATAARRICGQCFVRQECLAYAVADASLLGIWGGASELERRALRRGEVA